MGLYFVFPELGYRAHEPAGVERGWVALTGHNRALVNVCWWPQPRTTFCTGSRIEAGQQERRPFLCVVVCWVPPKPPWLLQAACLGQGRASCSNRGGGQQHMQQR
jgi:hypothetical protein